MEIKEYLKRATAKIYNYSKQQAVSMELEDHILNQQAFYEEIGYDMPESEEKAVENMGETELLAEQLASIHNNPSYIAFDIVGTVLWLFAIGGVHNVLNKYILGDVGLVGITLASGLFFVGANVFFSFINVIRNRKAPLFFNLFISIVTAGYLFLINTDISKCGYNFRSVLKLVFDGTISTNSASADVKGCMIISAVFLALSLMIFIIDLVLVIRFNNQENTLKDNHFKKLLKNILLVVSCVTIACSALVGISIFNIQDKIEESYMSDYNLLFDIANNCDSLSDAKKYAKENKLSYTESKDELIINASLSTISISKPKKDEVQLKAYEELFVNIMDASLSDVPQYKEAQSDYTICYSLANLTAFKNGYDSLSLKKIATQPSDLDILFDAQTKEQENREIINTFGSCYPKTITVEPSNDRKRHYTYIKYEYVAGTGENAFEESFDETLQSENAQKVKVYKQELLKLLNENPNISNKDLAKALNVKYVQPDIKYEEYEKMIKTVLRQNDYQITDTVTQWIKTSYKMLYYFNFDDNLQVYRFDEDVNVDVVSKNKEKLKLVVYGSKTDYRFMGFDKYGDEAEKVGEYQSHYYGMFRKTICDGIGYYDINGHAYSSYQNVAYYSRDGERFRYFAENDAQGKLIEKYFIGSRGTKCIANEGFVDKDGYFVSGAGKDFKKNGVNGESKITVYHDSDGVEYIQACEASWDSNGNLLDFDKYLPEYE